MSIGSRPASTAASRSCGRRASARLRRRSEGWSSKASSQRPSASPAPVPYPTLAVSAASREISWPYGSPVATRWTRSTSLTALNPSPRAASAASPSLPRRSSSRAAAAWSVSSAGITVSRVSGTSAGPASGSAGRGRRRRGDLRTAAGAPSDCTTTTASALSSSERRRYRPSSIPSRPGTSSCAKRKYRSAATPVRLLTGGERVPRGGGRHGGALDLADPLHDAVPLSGPKQRAELMVDVVASAEAVEEAPHPLAPLGNHALGVDAVAEGRPRRVRPADLDRAPRIEGRDLLAREHLLAGPNRWGNALVDVHDVACPRPIEQPVEHPLSSRAGAAVRPPGRADLQDPRVADRVDRPVSDEVDAHVDASPGEVLERELVAGADRRAEGDAHVVAGVTGFGEAHRPGQVLVRDHLLGLHHALELKGRVEQVVGDRSLPLVAVNGYAVDLRDVHRVSRLVLGGGGLGTRAL